MARCKCLNEMNYRIKKWAAEEQKLRKLLESLPNGQGDECNCPGREKPYLVFVNDNDEQSTVKYCCKCGGWIEWDRI